MNPTRHIARLRVRCQRCQSFLIAVAAGHWSALICPGCDLASPRP